MSDKPEILSEDAILDLQIEIRNCDSEDANAAEKKILASHEALRAERDELKDMYEAQIMNCHLEAGLIERNRKLRAEVERLNRVLKTVNEGHKDALKDSVDCIEKHQVLVAACGDCSDDLDSFLAEVEAHTRWGAEPRMTLEEVIQKLRPTEKRLNDALAAVDKRGE
jgi:hypothetical protein